MTAAVLAALDVPTLLLANNIGDDEQGRSVGTWLHQHQVPTTAVASADLSTPWIVVVADDHHTRTWFAHLPGVVDGLATVDLSAIATASYVYLDAYELIETAVLRVIEVTRAAAVPLLMNLGGSPLSAALHAAVAGYEKLLIQTNVDDGDHATAIDVASSLLAETGAAWVVVTAGAFGAVAVSRSERITVPAFPVDVRHTHCAGAAFSGGLLYGLRAGWSMEQSMALAAASGALRCHRRQGAPLPSLPELLAMLPPQRHSAAS